MKKVCHLAIAFLLALVSAALVAYAIAHLAHYGLGLALSTLREQALICAALIAGLVTTEMLASTKDNK